MATDAMLGPQVTERHVLRPHRGVLVTASVAEALRIRKVWRRLILMVEIVSSPGWGWVTYIQKGRVPYEPCVGVTVYSWF